MSKFFRFASARIGGFRRVVTFWAGDLDNHSSSTLRTIASDSLRSCRRGGRSQWCRTVIARIGSCFVISFPRFDSLALGFSCSLYLLLTRHLISLTLLSTSDLSMIFTKVPYPRILLIELALSCNRENRNTYPCLQNGLIHRHKRKMQKSRELRQVSARLSLLPPHQLLLV